MKKILAMDTVDLVEAGRLADDIEWALAEGCTGHIIGDDGTEVIHGFRDDGEHHFKITLANGHEYKFTLKRTK